MKTVPAPRDINLNFISGFFSCALLFKHWKQSSTAIFRAALSGVIIHLSVIIFYFRVASYVEGDPRIYFLTYTSLIYVTSAMVQAIVLSVGLIRFRYLYQNNMRTLKTVTWFVVLGIVFVLLTGIVGAILLSAGLLGLSVVNVVAGLAIIYCAAMDILLSAMFLNALMRGLNMNEVASKELIFSNDAKRLTATAVISALFGLTQLVAGILHAVLPADKAITVTADTDFANFIPAWLYIYSLNTFIHMSYSTTKNLVEKNSLSVMGLQQRSSHLQITNFSSTSSTSKTEENYKSSETTVNYPNIDIGQTNDNEDIPLDRVAPAPVFDQYKSNDVMRENWKGNPYNQAENGPRMVSIRDERQPLKGYRARFEASSVTENDSKAYFFGINAAIYILSGAVQAFVLSIGLVRFRYLYNMQPRKVKTITGFVLPGIILMAAGGLAGGIASILGYSTILINLLAGIAIIYSAGMDILLSVLFINALIKGLNMDSVAAKDLFRSEDAKRLVITGFFSTIFGVTLIVISILQVTLPKDQLQAVMYDTYWIYYFPAWLYVYGLNTFLHMSYDTAKEIVAKNTLSVINSANPLSKSISGGIISTLSGSKSQQSITVDESAAPIGGPVGYSTSTLNYTKQQYSPVERDPPIALEPVVRTSTFTYPSQHNYLGSVGSDISNDFSNDFDETKSSQTLTRSRSVTFNDDTGLYRGYKL
ncbi:hypothetical protein HK098_001264 [Nowakowskiella sp. JEL0407]|nr:hypothetical protein HK098_001264 [Nowakowskiella sp. JEL0407]